MSEEPSEGPKPTALNAEEQLASLDAPPKDQDNSLPGAAPAEHGGIGSGPPQASPLGSLPIVLPTKPKSDPNDVPTTSTADLAADDNDLIEKEWVDKAKEIVAKTRSDPYKQTEAMNVFKADYMKKRYNKIIKVDQ